MFSFEIILIINYCYLFGNHDRVFRVLADNVAKIFSAPPWRSIHKNLSPTAFNVDNFF